MDEEQFAEEQSEEQEASRAQRIAESIGRTLGGTARGVGSAARGVVGGLSSTAPRVVPNLSASSPIYQQLYPQPEEPKDELADLFEVPDPDVDNDVYVDDLLELDDEEGVEDLLAVSHEDIMLGTSKIPRRPKPKLQRTGKVYIPPTIQGL